MISQLRSSDYNKKSLQAEWDLLTPPHMDGNKGPTATWQQGVTPIQPHHPLLPRGKRSHAFSASVHMGSACTLPNTVS